MIFVPDDVKTSCSVECRQIHGVFYEVDVVTGLSECFPSGERGAEGPHGLQSIEDYDRWRFQLDDHLPERQPGIVLDVRKSAERQLVPFRVLFDPDARLLLIIHTTRYD